MPELKAEVIRENSRQVASWKEDDSVHLRQRIRCGGVKKYTRVGVHKSSVQGMHQNRIIDEIPPQSNVDNCAC